MGAEEEVRMRQRATTQEVGLWLWYDGGDKRRTSETVQKTQRERWNEQWHKSTTAQLNGQVE